MPAKKQEEMKEPLHFLKIVKFKIRTFIRDENSNLTLNKSEKKFLRFLFLMAIVGSLILSARIL
ncbi:hypothetical protein D1B31_18485 [Neobacillus notoginsengisoli]|uniref:Uncharacterized protein n=1 Tax=Neobacillus notoginsengisoli TaxID=1578198 RepID=A0A417YQR8_9BACI|nr:hypothetical protein [Neobacillus notoginsengisoli]RHW36066.1 hypothetical protein D1B31_18485 [Neobacillus notoginsengisoli]